MYGQQGSQRHPSGPVPWPSFQDNQPHETQVDMGQYRTGPPLRTRAVNWTHAGTMSSVPGPGYDITSHKPVVGIATRREAREASRGDEHIRIRSKRLVTTTLCCQVVHEAVHDLVMRL
jgi:hypothetical protein